MTFYQPAVWRRLTTASRRWLLGFVSLSLTFAATVGALIALESGRQAKLSDEARLAEVRAVHRHAAAMAAVERVRQMPGHAWQAALRVGLPTDAVLSEAHQSALPVGLVVKRATVATPAANPASSTVVRSDLTMELVGPYPALKIWLRELLARHPSLAVLTLSLRRAAGDEGVEVTVTFRMFGSAR